MNPTDWVPILTDYVKLGGPRAAERHGFAKQTLRAKAHQFGVRSDWAKTANAKLEYEVRAAGLAFLHVLTESDPYESQLESFLVRIGPELSLLVQARLRSLVRVLDTDCPVHGRRDLNSLRERFYKDPALLVQIGVLQTLTSAA